MMDGYLGALFFVLLTVVTMFFLLRSRAMKERFTVWWLVIVLGVLVVGLFPGLLPWLSDTLGFDLPSNFLFFVASLMFLLISVQYSVELSKLDEKARTLAEEVAILRATIEQHHGTGLPGADGRKPIGEE